MADIVWLEDNTYTISDWIREMKEKHKVIMCFEPNQLVAALNDAQKPEFLIVDLMIPAGARGIDSGIRNYFEQNDLASDTEFVGVAVTEWALDKYPELSILILTALPSMADKLMVRLDDDKKKRLSILSKHNPDLGLNDILKALGV